MIALSMLSCQLISQISGVPSSTATAGPAISPSPAQTEISPASPTPTSGGLETAPPSPTFTSEPNQPTLTPSLTLVVPTPLPTITSPVIPTTLPPLPSPTPETIGPKVYQVTIHNNYYFPLQVYIDTEYIMTIPGRRHMWYRGILEGTHLLLLCPWQGRCIKKVILFDEDKELWTGP